MPVHNDPDSSIVDKINKMYPQRSLRFDDINPYMADADTVYSWFQDAGYSEISYLENTIEVAEKCTATIEKRKNLLPKYSKLFKLSSHYKY